MNDAIELLKRYGRERDEEAFREVVARYFGLVQGVALRRLNGDESAALDVSQVVFTDLARQADRLPQETMLGGWLHSHTCFVASKFIRSESRRAAREKEAAQMNTPEESNDEWRAISPVLDDALEELSADDRSAILLRFFEGHDLRGVGAALCVSEDAAQKRVQRALGRLKAFLESRGASISVTALAGALLANAASACAGSTIQTVATRAMLSNGSSGSAAKKIMSEAGRAAKIVAILVLIPALLIGFWLRSARIKSDRSPKANPVANSAAQAQTSIGTPSVRNASAADDVSAATSVNAPIASIAAGGADQLLLHVINRADSKPIAGATVRASTATSPRPTGIINAGDLAFQTDAEGIARIPIPNPAPERFLVESWAAGFDGWITVWEPRKGEIIPREHTMTLERGVEIGGHVIDVAGKPIEAAAVKIMRIWHGSESVENRNDHEQLNTVTNFTDAAGLWSDKHVPEGLLEHIFIRVSHANFAGADVNIDPPRIAELRARRLTTTLGEGIRITGRVTDTNNEPIASAKVAFGRQFSSIRKEAVTDSDGRYELRNLTFDPLVQENVVAAASPGYAPQTKAVTNSSSSVEANFILSPGAIIRGRVVNAAGEPIKGASVSRESGDLDDDAIVWSAETDADGRFVWVGAPAKPQSFYFGANGYAQIRNKKLAPGPDEHLITMTKRVTLHGIVRNAATGATIPRFSVLPGQGSTDELDSWSYRTETEFKNGVFEMEISEASHNVVRIRASGFFDAIYEIPPNGQLLAELKPSTALEGTVVDAGGRAVAGAQVAALGTRNSTYASIRFGRFAQGQIRADNCKTDEEGRFSLPLSAPAVTLVAVHPDAGYAEVRIDDGQNHELHLQPWGRIEGTLIGDDGPLAGVELSLVGREATRVLLNNFHTTTDESGRFTFEQTPPAELTLARMVPIGPDTRSSCETTNVIVAPGAVTYIDFHVAKNPRLLKEVPHH